MAEDRIEISKLAQIKQSARELVDDIFDNEGLEAIFTHARNVLTGAAVVAAGLYAASHFGAKPMPGTWTLHFAGYAVAVLGGVLLLLNLISGLRRLAKRKQHLWLRVLAIFLYTALSIRLTQVIIFFRWAP